jgi:hypothetical protein
VHAFPVVTGLTVIVAVPVAEPTVAISATEIVEFVDGAV